MSEREDAEVIENKSKEFWRRGEVASFPWPRLVQGYSRVRPPPTLGGAETRIGLRFFEKGCSFMRRSSAPSTVWYLSSYFKFPQVKGHFWGVIKCISASFCWGGGLKLSAIKMSKILLFFFPNGKNVAVR